MPHNNWRRRTATAPKPGVRFRVHSMALRWTQTSYGDTSTMPSSSE